MIGGEEIHALGADLSTEVRCVPHEALAGPKVHARLLARGLHDDALIAGRSMACLLANLVERDLRDLRGVPGNPCILARPGQSRHENDFAPRIVVRLVVRIAILFAEVEKAAVMRWKLPRTIQACLPIAELAEHLDR